MIHDYADARRMQPPERLLFSAAARDARMADLMEAYGTRNIRPGRFLRSALPRAIAVHARRRLSGSARRAELSGA
jgi:hypothetical protein